MQIAIVAGTGTANLVTSESWSRTDTPFGPAFAATCRVGTQDVIVLARHGPGLNIPPHLINYRANMWALKEARVRHVIATAAVGSLRRTLKPGTLGVVTDFIDFTKRRVATFTDQPDKKIVHTDFSIPYCPRISSAIEQATGETEAGTCARVTYVCVDGPRYETPAEVRMFVSLGGDVVGMTGVPEVVLARELGLCYGTVPIVTNYASGVSHKPLSHTNVLEAVRKQERRVRDVLYRVVALIGADGECQSCSARSPDPSDAPP